MTHSRHSIVGLMLRHIRAQRLQMALVAALISAMSFLAAAAPRALDIMLTNALHHDLAGYDKTSLDLTSRGFGSPSTSLGAGNWGSMDLLLTGERDRLPETARKIAGKPALTVLFPEKLADAYSPKRQVPQTDLVLGIDPLVNKHVRIVEGKAPAKIPAPLIPPFDGEEPPDPNQVPIDIILSRAASKATSWQVGDVRNIGGSPFTLQLVRLSGIYEPVDPKGDFWIHTAAAIKPDISSDGFVSKITATGWIDPTSWVYTQPISGGSRLVAWIPLAPEKLRSGDTRQAAEDLTKFTNKRLNITPDARSQDLSLRYGVSPLETISFSTEMTETLHESERNYISTYALALMLALGPLLAGGCAIFLACGLLKSRQRAAVKLAEARGASDWQLRAALAAQGLIAGLPFALAGGIAAVLVFPAEPGPLGLILPLLVAFAPAVALAASPLRPTVGGANARQMRHVAELCVLGLAAAAVVGLRQRGLSSDRTRVDWLLTAAPLLLSLVGCLIAQRLVKPVASVVRAWRARQRGLVSLVGSARAAGQPTTGLAVALTLVSGLAVAVFSATTLATFGGGISESARAAAAADLRVTSPNLTDGSAAEINKLPGVVDVAAVSFRPATKLVLGPDKSTVTIIAVDAATLHRVQSGISPATVNPPKLRIKPGPGEPMPAVLSRELSQGDITKAKLADRPLDVVATADAPLPFAPGIDRWVLVDRDVLASQDIDGSITSVLLVDAKSGQIANVRKQITAQLKGAKIATATTERSRLEEDPRIPGVRTISIAATGTAALLVALAVAMALLAGADGRARDVAVARALGMRPRGSRWLPVWEVGPLALASAFVGVVVGIATPILTLGATDLTPFTGGIEQPALVFQPRWTAALLVAVLVLAIVGSLASVVAASRRDLVASLRVMED